VEAVGERESSVGGEDASDTELEANKGIGNPQLLRIVA
jgi:hypothetical protein